MATIHDGAHDVIIVGAGPVGLLLAIELALAGVEPLVLERLTEPDATIKAFADHGTIARTVDADVDEAEAVWRELAEVGVDMDDVAAQLEREGVSSFEKSFDELLTALQTKANELSTKG